MTSEIAKQAAALKAADTDSKPQKRQAISGMIVTIILIGIVVAIGGILATTTTDIVQTGLVLDAVEIKRLAIQNTATQSYITGMVKNAGNSDITDIHVIVRHGGNEFVAIFQPDDINSGVSATVNAVINDGSNTSGTVGVAAIGTTAAIPPVASAGTDVRLTIGQEYQVEIRANIAGGGQYSQTKVLSPQ